MEGNQVGVPREGFYKTRLISKGPWVAVRIWHGQPVIDGEVQDRSPRWCIELNGASDRFDKEAGHRVPLDAIEHWPWVCGHPISEREYGFLLRRKTWAEDHAPDHPAANPYAPIDLASMKPFEP